MGLATTSLDLSEIHFRTIEEVFPDRKYITLQDFDLTIMVSSFVGGVKIISEVINTPWCYIFQHQGVKEVTYTHTIWHPFDVLSNQMGATNN